VEAIQLLDTERTVRRLKRRKPFELVQWKCALVHVWNLRKVSHQFH
jgi:hypothetical protein